MRRIGIDVGSTHTDAVLVEGETIVGSIKTPTTGDVMSGITKALQKVLAETGASPSSMDAVMIGTTQFTNAVAQRRDVSRVAALRICLPASASLEPFIDWPEDLADKVRGRVYLLAGGHEFDGRLISPLDEIGVRETAREIREAGILAAGVTSVFSPLTAEHEERTRQIFAEEAPNVSVTLSHFIGRIGLLERENATLLNASLLELAAATTVAFTDAIASSGISAQLFLTQNDGTVMLAEAAARFPVFSFASGPTNSMRGAAFLSKMDRAMVVDVGGTTADVGMLQNGFPREANNAIEIGGVRTLFRMPDLMSIALGGGTLIDQDSLAIGPQSTGYQLLNRGMVFGGDELTATDIAVAAGLVELGDGSLVADLPSSMVERTLQRIHERVATAVDQMKTDAAEIPVIAVGGGAFLVPREMAGVSRVIHVVHAGVANAVGAAIAQISGECDQIFQGLSREEAIRQAHQIAEDRAVEGGADRATLQTVEIEDLPLAYMPGDSLRARVRVVGDIAA